MGTIALLMRATFALGDAHFPLIISFRVLQGRIFSQTTVKMMVLVIAALDVNG